LFGVARDVGRPPRNHLRVPTKRLEEEAVAVRVSVDYGGGRRIPDVPAGRDELGVLAGFREAWHGCLTRRADALFELTDALLCAPGPVSSVPSLSLEPTFRRGHGSLYAALACGEVDAKAARDLLVAHRPADWPLVFAVDTSSWPRCDAECSPQRGLYYHRRGTARASRSWRAGATPGSPS